MIKEIRNPWREQNIFNCFGCSHSNPIGLKLSFFESDGFICARFTPDANHQGYINTLHGGIQATLHDEIASWTVYTKAGTSGMTTDLNVKYLKSVSINGGSILLKAKVEKMDHRFATIKTVLLDADGNECSTGEVTYRLFPLKMATEKMHYPGVDAFYNDSISIK